jgi:hypothetical protein
MRATAATKSTARTGQERDERPRESFARRDLLDHASKWAALLANEHASVLLRQLMFRNVARQSQLTHAEFRFLDAVLAHANRKFEAWPSLLVLRFECGREKRARGGDVRHDEQRLKNVRARLGRAGWLMWRREGGHKVIYTLCIPPGVVRPGHQGWRPRAAG